MNWLALHTAEKVIANYQLLHRILQIIRLSTFLYRLICEFVTEYLLFFHLALDRRIESKIKRFGSVFDIFRLLSTKAFLRFNVANVFDVNAFKVVCDGCCFIASGNSVWCPLIIKCNLQFIPRHCSITILFSASTVL